MDSSEMASPGSTVPVVATQMQAALQSPAARALLLASAVQIGSSISSCVSRAFGTYASAGVGRAAAAPTARATCVNLASHKSSVSPLSTSTSTASCASCSHSTSTSARLPPSYVAPHKSFAAPCSVSNPTLPSSSTSTSTAWSAKPAPTKASSSVPNAAAFFPRSFYAPAPSHSLAALRASLRGVHSRVCAEVSSPLLNLSAAMPTSTSSVESPAPASAPAAAKATSSSFRNIKVSSLGYRITSLYPSSIPFAYCVAASRALGHGGIAASLANPKLYFSHSPLYSSITSPSSSSSSSSYSASASSVRHFSSSAGASEAQSSMAHTRFAPDPHGTVRIPMIPPAIAATSFPHYSTFLKAAGLVDPATAPLDQLPKEYFEMDAAGDSDRTDLLVPPGHPTLVEWSPPRASANQVEEPDFKGDLVGKALYTLKKIVMGIYNGLIRFAIGFKDFVVKYSTNPSLIRPALSKVWGIVKHEAKHYWHGSKLLAADIRTATSLARVRLQGGNLTRRERRQLVRTTGDIFRLVPFAVIVLVPFLEFALPLLLKLFPNMLPSTFKDKHQEAAKVRNELKARLELADFLQDTMESMARQKVSTSKAALASGDSASSAASAASAAEKMMGILQAVRAGQRVDNNQLVAVASLFQDDITLDNLSRPHLIAMCKYMKLSGYGSNTALRERLRDAIEEIREDDELIEKEGIDTLTMEELKEACRDRGMRATGITMAGLRHNMREWIDLSVHKEVPASLLLLSRALSISERPPVEAIRAALSTIDSDTIDEVFSEAGLDEDNPVRRLEAMRRQNAIIDDEDVRKVIAERKRQLSLVASSVQPAPATPAKPVDVKINVTSVGSTSQGAASTTGAGAPGAASTATSAAAAAAAPAAAASGTTAAATPAVSTASTSTSPSTAAATPSSSPSASSPTSSASIAQAVATAKAAASAGPLSATTPAAAATLSEVLSVVQATSPAEHSASTKSAATPDAKAASPPAAATATDAPVSTPASMSAPSSGAKPHEHDVQERLLSLTDTLTAITSPSAVTAEREKLKRMIAEQAEILEDVAEAESLLKTATAVAAQVAQNVEPAPATSTTSTSSSSSPSSPSSLSSSSPSSSASPSTSQQATTLLDVTHTSPIAAAASAVVAAASAGATAMPTAHLTVPASSSVSLSTSSPSTITTTSSAAQSAIPLSAALPVAPVVSAHPTAQTIAATAEAIAKAKAKAAASAPAAATAAAPVVLPSVPPPAAGSSAAVSISSAVSTTPPSAGVASASSSSSSLSSASSASASVLPAASQGPYPVSAIARAAAEIRAKAAAAKQAEKSARLEAELKMQDALRAKQELEAALAKLPSKTTAMDVLMQAVAQVAPTSGGAGSSMPSPDRLPSLFWPQKPRSGTSHPVDHDPILRSLVEGPSIRTPKTDDERAALRRYALRVARQATRMFQRAYVTAEVIRATPKNLTPEQRSAMEEEARRSRHMVQLSKQVGTMLRQLEGHIEKADKTIGDRLHLLDKDKDGRVSTKELQVVLKEHLKAANSESEAAALVAKLKVLSASKGWYMSVEEIQRIAEEFSELTEEERVAYLEQQEIAARNALDAQAKLQNYITAMAAAQHKAHEVKEAVALSKQTAAEVAEAASILHKP